MTPVEKPLTYNLKQRLFIRLRNPKTNTLTQIAHFPFCRVPEASGRQPEAYRKDYLLFSVLPQFRKLPEGSRKAYRKLTGSCCFTWVPEGPGRFPEGCPEGKNSLDISSKPL